MAMPALDQSSKNLQFATFSRMGGEVSDACARTADRMFYQVFYALAVTFSHASPRRRRALAKRFANTWKGNVKKATPPAMSLFLNALLLWCFSIMALRAPLETNSSEEISLTINEQAGFLVSTHQPAPPSGGGGAAEALNQAISTASQALATPLTTAQTHTQDLAALTTTTPTSFDIPPATVPSVDPATMANAPASLPSQSSEGGSGQGSGIGPGSGHGSGGGRAGHGPARQFQGHAITATYVGVILDISGSMHRHSKSASRASKKVLGSKNANNIVECNGCTIEALMSGIQSALTTNNRIKSIVWIADLRDIYQPTRIMHAGQTRSIHELYAEIERILQENGISLFVTSYAKQPSPELLGIIERSGGTFHLSLSHNLD